MPKINFNAEDLISHAGVAAIIKNRYGHILMQKHKKYGFWTIPVGKVKPRQSLIRGLKQELQEECNITIQKTKKLIKKTSSSLLSQYVSYVHY